MMGEARVRGELFPKCGAQAFWEYSLVCYPLFENPTPLPHPHTLRFYPPHKHNLKHLNIIGSKATPCSLVKWDPHPPLKYLKGESGILIG
jgi:hypothetical protein